VQTASLLGGEAQKLTKHLLFQKRRKEKKKLTIQGTNQPLNFQATRFGSLAILGNLWHTHILLF
jgi:hypothetical protein